MSIGNLSAAHAFNYIVLRVKSGLTNCEDLAMALLIRSYTKLLYFIAAKNHMQVGPQLD